MERWIENKDGEERQAENGRVEEEVGQVAEKRREEVPSQVE